jgi:hypothetical protein
MSVSCEPRHEAIYDQWKATMHAHAMKSPAMIAQTNQLIRAELGATKAPDPRGICVNCHGPAGAPSDRDRDPEAHSDSHSDSDADSHRPAAFSAAHQTKLGSVRQSWTHRYGAWAGSDTQSSKSVLQFAAPLWLNFDR